MIVIIIIIIFILCNLFPIYIMAFVSHPLPGLMLGNILVVSLSASLFIFFFSSFCRDLASLLFFHFLTCLKIILMTFCLLVVVHIFLRAIWNTCKNIFTLAIHAVLSYLHFNTRFLLWGSLTLSSLSCVDRDFLIW